MFHDGDLQSGISRAISEQKLVACFVRQDGDEDSRVWEEDWLGQKPRTTSDERWTPGMGEIFATKAVLLRIEYGSQESTFLNAFCPITKAPTVVIIHNGQVLEKLEGGVEKQEFIERMSKALGLEVSFMTREQYNQRREAQGNRSGVERGDKEATGSAGDSASRAAEDAQEGAPSSNIETPHSSDEASQQLQGEAAAALNPTTSPTDASPAMTEQDQANMSSLFPDRAQKLEAEKVKREAAEKAEKQARTDARRKEAEEAHAHHRGDKGKGKASDEAVEKEKARRDWLVQQKKRKDDAKRDKERILAQIEQDKQERKARSQRERAVEAPSEPLQPSADAASRRRMGAGGMCNLAIRLFDGSSIKGRFEPSTTLDTGVRDWIKETASAAGAADVPFTFKQIMAPLPSRSIEVSEEHQTLQDLGLVPNATLVLVPVSGYTEAYSGGGRGYMSTALHAAYGVVNTATGVVSSVLSFVPGLGGGAASEAASTSTEDTARSSTESSNSGNVKMKTLADQRAEAAKKDQKAEFYNGNSSAFEGRKDDDDKK